MKIAFMAVAIFATAIALTIQNSPARASTSTDKDTGTYVSSLPPIYPTQEQQTGTLWGTTEIVRCPDSYKLLFDSEPSSLGLPPTPSCVPITADQSSGGTP